MNPGSDSKQKEILTRAIEERRDWYRALAEDIPVLITRISPGGLVTYVNRASAEIIGLPVDEIVGRNFYDLVPAEYRETVKSAFASLTPQKPLIIYEHYNRERLFRWKNRAVFNEAGELKEYFTVGEDITESKVAEESLLGSEARNRALVNALPDLIFRYSRDGYYIDAEIKDDKRLTEAGRRLHREGRLIGSNIKDVLSPEMAKTVASTIARVIKNDKLQVLEYSYMVEGKVRHHEARMVKSGPEEVMSIVRDITDRKIIEESLRYQLEFEKLVARISSAFVNAPAGDIGQPIMVALKKSGQFFGADRSYVFRFSEDGQYMSIFHEWCAPGVSSQIERNQNLPVANTPWWIGQLLKNEYVLIPDVEALPPEAHKDRDDFRIEEIKSLLTLPLIRGGQTVGFFGFDAVLAKKSWSKKQINLLIIIAEIIAGALSKHDAEEKLKESEERYREILATIEEGYYEADLQGRITYCNDAACKLFGGYSREELLGLTYDKLYTKPEEAYNTFNQVVKSGKPEKGLILEMIRKDGSVRFGEISISLVKDKEGKVTGFKGIGKDVTDRIEYERELQYLSMHDQLTGIYNRAYFEVELKRLENGRDYPITIISADLDGLKLINDTMGHDAGDGCPHDLS